MNCKLEDRHTGFGAVLPESHGVQVRVGFGSYVWGFRMLELGSGFGYKLVLLYFVGIENLKSKKRECSLRQCL